SVGQCGAQACDDVTHAVLIRDQAVEVSLYQNRKPRGPDIVLGQRQSVQVSSFCIDRSFGRVQILWLAFSDDAPAECDGPVLRIGNREHQTAAKPVVQSAGFLHYREPAQVDFFKRGSSLAKMLGKRIPAIGRPSEPKLLRSRFADSPVNCVLSGALSIL